jgi:DNA-binding transcriptional LysR family regulator
MELRQLHYFVAVAEKLSFTRAGETLHLTQPALTHQIKLLEEELNVLLFERNQGRISLTEPGRVFLSGTQRVLAAILTNVEAAQHAARRNDKLLTVGYVSSLHYNLVPPTLIAFHERYPDVALNLLDMSPADQFKALENGKIDLAFLGLRDSLSSPELEGRRVAQYRILVAMSKQHPLARCSHIALEELNGTTLLTMSKEVYPEWQEAIDRHILERQFKPGNVREVDGVVTILTLVGMGHGIALLPEQLRLLPHYGVVLRTLMPSVKVWAWIAWRRDNSLEGLRRYLGLVTGV